MQILYEAGYYDGPLAGVGLYNDELCWFEVSPGTEFQEPRKMNIYPLARGIECIAVIDDTEATYPKGVAK